MATYSRKLKDSSGNFVAPATRTACVYMSDNTTLDDFIAKIYPTGSIYMSTDSISPASLYGGEWEQIQGKFLLGSSSSYTVESTGGEETHKLTVNEMPSHTHSITGGSNKFYTDYIGTGSGKNEITEDRSPQGQNPLAADATGGSQPHNNMPPYYAVNIWRRAA